MDKFDLIVIGGGPAGYAAAMRGIDFGKKVCLIEMDRVGGAGIYNGALSSKTLWEMANKVSHINESLISGGRSPYEMSWKEVRKVLDEAIFERKFNTRVIENFCKLNLQTHCFTSKEVKALLSLKMKSRSQITAKKK